MPRVSTQPLHLSRVLTASLAVTDSAGAAPASIEWAPAGTHEIRAYLNRKPASLTITISEAIASALDQELQALLAQADSGQQSRPFIDFDHEGGRAAAIPKRFYWDEGIRLEVDWTPAGKTSVEGREYSYFSPEFIWDEQTGAIHLPKTGPIGGLVNTPAFQSIERLAARAFTSTEPNMWEQEILEILIALGVITQAEAETRVAENAKTRLQEALQAAQSLPEVTAKLAAAQAELEKANAQIQAARTDAITGKIDALVQAKRITEAGKPALLKACLAAEDDGAALLSSVSAAAPAPVPPAPRRIVGALPVGPTQPGAGQTLTARCAAANGIRLS